MPDETYLSAQDFLGKQTLTPTEEKEVFSAATKDGIDIVYERTAVKITSGRFAGLIDYTNTATFPVSFLKEFYQEKETDTGEIYQPSTSYLEQTINKTSKDLEGTGVLELTFRVDERSGNLTISKGELTWTLIADRA